MKRNKFFRFSLFPALFLLTLLVCAPKTLGLWQEETPAAPPGNLAADSLPMTPLEPAQSEEDAIPVIKLEPSQPVEQKPAEPETPPVPEKPPAEPQTMDEFFADTLFIGDSRTVGISEYAGISTASFFCNVGMTVYSVFDAKCQVEEKTYTLEELLTERTYGKIHLMLGINELGYDYANTVKVYGQVVEKLRSLQPDAVLYLGANLHVDAKRNSSDAIFNNANLDRFNKATAELADGTSVLYLDVNPLFDDSQGNLAADYTGDGTHVYGSCYTTWGKWLYETMGSAEVRE